MSVDVKVRDNNIDSALKVLKNKVGPTLSAVKDRKEYKKPGVRRREEQNRNTINSIRNNKKNNSRRSYSKMSKKKYAA